MYTALAHLLTLTIQNQHINIDKGNNFVKDTASALSKPCQKIKKQDSIAHRSPEAVL